MVKEHYHETVIVNRYGKTSQNNGSEVSLKFSRMDVDLIAASSLLFFSLIIILILCILRIKADRNLKTPENVIVEEINSGEPFPQENITYFMNRKNDDFYQFDDSRSTIITDIDSPAFDHATNDRNTRPLLPAYVIPCRETVNSVNDIGDLEIIPR